MPNGTAANVLRGMCSVYVAAANTTAYSTTSCTHVGYTNDGVQISKSVEVTDIEVDQETEPIGAEIGKQEKTVAFKFAEATLSNIALAFGGTPNTTAQTLDLDAAPDYICLIAKGRAPNSGTTTQMRTWIFPNVMPSGNSVYPYQKGQNQSFEVTFKYYKRGTVSASLTDAAS